MISRTVPIDSEHLLQQVPALHKCGDLAEYYLTEGLEQRLDPTQFFCTDWYAWQNPDWSLKFEAPYLHYLETGCREGRDPSPFVDVAKYVDATGGGVPSGQIYGAILDGLRAPALGVYESLSDLERAQRAFLGGITPLAHRMTPEPTGKTSLVVCQAGPGAMIDHWLGDAHREWDLLLNYYDATGMRANAGEYVCFQKGTKFTAMKLLTERHGELIARYDHVLFIDDDVEIGASDLNRMFAVCRQHGLDLAQMSLTSGSSCNWQPLFRREGGASPRAVSAVEIMMPVFSRRALGWIAPTLGRSISGFGLDLVWGKIVGDRGGRIAVLDEVSATHARAVDHSGGSYYQYLRRHGINAKAELWALLKRYDAPREIVTV